MRVKPTLPTQKLTQSNVKNARSILERKIILTARSQQALLNVKSILKSVGNCKNSDSIIKAMPADDYLEVINLLNDIINGSIDEQI